MMRNRKLVVCLPFFLALMLVMVSCQPAAVEAPAEEEPMEEAVPTEVPEPEGPQVGGKMVVVISREPDILDPALTNTSGILSFMGSALVEIDPDMKYEPYLAESWEFSEDGLTWTFHLRKDILFHDGTPMTARDFVWTFDRAQDPELASPARVSMMESITKTSAPDDYTLVLELNNPDGGLLYSLSGSGFFQPLLQSAVEAGGADYGRNPVGVGPWKFKEWVTGDHLTYVRNPDFKWGPMHVENKGAPYVEELEFRFIPEYSTILAGLEAGEIDFFDDLLFQDLDTVKNLGTFDVFETLQIGISPALFWNVTKPPFDDLKVRRALSHAVDRQAMADLKHPGYGEIQYGPLNRGNIGYWAGIEDLGYGYDLEKAKQLMAEAGYTAGADGILEKDDQKLTITIYAGAGDANNQKTAEILQSQWSALGVDAKIEQIEISTLVAQYLSGELPDMMVQFDNTEGGEALFLCYYSQAFNVTQSGDPKLDELLNAIRMSANPDVRQEAINAAASYVVENVYNLSFTARPVFFVLSKDVKGAKFNPYGSFGGFDQFIDAYFE
jgi:peptide/nickel transport system substrate-binding protein